MKALLMGHLISAVGHVGARSSMKNHMCQEQPQSFQCISCMGIYIPTDGGDYNTCVWVKIRNMDNLRTLIAVQHLLEEGPIPQEIAYYSQSFVEPPMNPPEPWTYILGETGYCGDPQEVQQLFSPLAKEGGAISWEACDNGMPVALSTKEFFDYVTNGDTLKEEEIPPEEPVKIYEHDHDCKRQHGWCDCLTTQDPSGQPCKMMKVANPQDLTVKTFENQVEAFLEVVGHPLAPKTLEIFAEGLCVTGEEFEIARPYVTRATRYYLATLEEPPDDTICSTTTTTTWPAAAGDGESESETIEPLNLYASTTLLLFGCWGVSCVYKLAPIKAIENIRDSIRKLPLLRTDNNPRWSFRGGGHIANIVEGNAADAIAGNVPNLSEGVQSKLEESTIEHTARSVIATTRNKKHERQYKETMKKQSKDPSTVNQTFSRMNWITGVAMGVEAHSQESLMSENGKKHKKPREPPIPEETLSEDGKKHKEKPTEPPPSKAGSKGSKAGSKGSKPGSKSSKKDGSKGSKEGSKSSKKDGSKGSKERSKASKKPHEGSKEGFKQ